MERITQNPELKPFIIILNIINYMRYNNEII